MGEKIVIIYEGELQENGLIVPSNIQFEGHYQLLCRAIVGLSSELLHQLHNGIKQEIKSDSEE